MTQRALLDTGPLVAFLDRRDAHHAWSCEVLDGLRGPLRTCEAVFTEALYLLRAVRGGREVPLQMLEQGLIEIDFALQENASALRRLMKKYEDVPMSFADACLVLMAERDAAALILTLDRDFFRYRRHGRHSLQVLSPYDG